MVEGKSLASSCSGLAILAFAALTGLIGCSGGAKSSSPEASSKPASSESAGAEASASDTPAADDAPVVLGDLITPFDTPATLAEAEEGVEWEESPVIDTLELLREQKKSEPAQVSVEDALAMKNDSDEANKKILSALSVLAPEDGSGVNYAAVLNRTIQQDVSSLNPLLASSVAEAEVAGMLAFGMFTFDWNFNPCASADTVASWQTSKDRMLDKVVLRDDLTWSDGKPITAYDVEFSYKLIMTSQVPVLAQRQGTDQLAMVKAYDDHTLIYFHKKPLAINVWNLNFYVVPKHLYEKSFAEDPTLRNSPYHVKLEKKPISGGPYEIESRQRGSEVLLKRRESYYTHDGKPVREKPYFAKIRHRVIEDTNTQLLALKASDVDEALLGAEQWLTQTDSDDFYKVNTKARGAEWTFFYIGWNLKSPLFEDLRVRQAMAYAMNYDEMVNDLCYGLYPQCWGIYHPDAWMFPKDPAPLYKQDLDKAEDLLDEAGWADSDYDGVRDKEINGEIVPFEFTLMVSNKPDRIAICNLFRECLDSIGIRCNIASLEAAVFQERVQDKNFVAEYSGWGAGADPYTNKNIFGTGEGRNYGSYSNPEVDRLFDEGEVEFDREKRAEIYGKIHKLIFADQPYLFLHTRSSFYGFNKRLRGYRFSPRGPFSYGPGLGSVWVPADN
ncbi:Oligopeptide-binding protein AppA precursor [Botrimarina colliarenosi]|uniref:Oligopeptide-binding protein AppA n=2 Tax=Botrimarina colliarenosi TaxID=2528001 RepID=A0A5C6ABC7_9BACT|nr:Oligopeptide-binding protein AppA precursor [Botrimarina colliarenosi]